MATGIFDKELVEAAAAERIESLTEESAKIRERYVGYSLEHVDKVATDLLRARNLLAMSNMALNGYVELDLDDFILLDLLNYQRKTD